METISLLLALENSPVTGEIPSQIPLLPDGTKPLSEPILICYQWCLLALIVGKSDPQSDVAVFSDM